MHTPITSLRYRRHLRRHLLRRPERRCPRQTTSPWVLPLRRRRLRPPTTSTGPRRPRTLRRVPQPPPRRCLRCRLKRRNTRPRLRACRHPLPSGFAPIPRDSGCTIPRTVGSGFPPARRRPASTASPIPISTRPDLAGLGTSLRGDGDTTITVCGSRAPPAGVMFGSPTLASLFGSDDRDAVIEATRAGAPRLVSVLPPALA
jgi:hypothetical protein